LCGHIKAERKAHKADGVQIADEPVNDERKEEPNGECDKS